jgi:MFS family permease
MFFFITLAVYLLGALLTAFAWDLWSFILFRVITGAGIGGEYAAINSAIDELIPARLRGRIDLYINGSYWVGAALGALSTLVFLDPKIFPIDVGWRVGFFVGAVLSLFILVVRRNVPESPRWQVTHGHAEQAERMVGEIERRVESESGAALPPPDQAEAITLHPRAHVGFGAVIRTMFRDYRRRSMLGLSLMTAQAFLYNAIFFTYALVLTQFYAVPAADTGLYLLPFAAGNFLGVIVLGHYFDTIGRRQMIAATYLASALLLVITGYLFAQDALTAATLTLLWTAIFFFASPAASAAYLTVSEIFPLETRALAIAFFYSVGTGVGGIAAPWLFGTLIGTGSRLNVFYGYLFAAVLMIAAAMVAVIYGVAAERQSLERVARPLSAAGEGEG